MSNSQIKYKRQIKHKRQFKFQQLQQINRKREHMKPHQIAHNPRTRTMDKYKLTSSSKQKQSTIDLNDQIQVTTDQMQVMTNNLLHVKGELRQQNANQDPYEGQYELQQQSQEPKHRKEGLSRQQFYCIGDGSSWEQQSQDSNTHISSHVKGQHQPPLYEDIRRMYHAYLQSHKFSSNYQDKINELLDAEEDQIQVGNFIALFQMVYYFKEILTVEVLQEIQAKAFQAFLALIQQQQQCHSNKVTEGRQYKNAPKNRKQSQLLKAKVQGDKAKVQGDKAKVQGDKAKVQGDKAKVQGDKAKMLKTCLVQLIAICGIQSQQIVEFFVQLIIQNTEQFQLGFKVLMNMGLLGVKTLIKILNQDFQQLSGLILDHLSRNQLIIQEILVPALAYDLQTSSSSKDKNTSLTILTSLGPTAHSQKLIPTLLPLFKSNNINKDLLISTISSTGDNQGQQVLLGLLNQPNLNQDVGISIIRRITQTTKGNKINVTAIRYPVAAMFQMNRLYVFQAGARSCGSGQGCDSRLVDTLYLNPIVFSALLMKMLQNLESRTSPNQQIHATQSIELFTLPQVIAKEEQQSLPNSQVIEALLKLIDKGNKKSRLRQAAIEAFGRIPLCYDDSQIMEKLTVGLWSADASIRSVTCLTLANLEFSPHSKVVSRFSKLLRDNYWKVRISACQAIGSLIHEPNGGVVQSLTKCLKDGSINRELVCQTLIAIHPVCQQLLIQILRESKDNKIQQTILRSFNHPKLFCSQHLSQAIQAVFQFSGSKNKQTRSICMGVIDSLKNYSCLNSIQISYFKPKNILPFYYNFLDDLSGQIRDTALNYILRYGSYAQLILIEGMTKGKINCKVQCARGLGQKGVQNFRALLLGMRDTHQKVRRQCCESILQNFAIGDIVNEYCQKSSQSISLIYNIKDLIEGNFQMHSQIRVFMQQLVERLSQGIEMTEQVEEIDQGYDEQIENQINQFRQSMKMKSSGYQKQDRTEDLIQSQIQDAENIDPNIQQALKDMKEMNDLKHMRNIGLNQDVKSKAKRYYFKLNQAAL